MQGVAAGERGGGIRPAIFEHQDRFTATRRYPNVIRFAGSSNALLDLRIKCCMLRGMRMSLAVSKYL
jgi:hypothetical protein